MNRLLFCAAVATGLPGCNDLCGDASCRFTEAEWDRISSLAGLGDPQLDPVNKYAGVGNAAAEALGQQFYFDPRFSGLANNRDTLGRDISGGRAPVGEPVEISCATCHDPRIGGTDHTSSPGHVSVGAGWYDVNSQATVNSAYYDIKYWNGRYDSLVWQIMGVNESGVSMNSTRLKNAWVIHDNYLDAYNEVFGEDHPFPFDYREDGITREVMASMLLTDGTCALVGGACPLEAPSGAPLCHVAREGTTERCLPVWPVAGRTNGGGCELDTFGAVANAVEDGAHYFDANPFDAFDCMRSDDGEDITRVHVNFAKAIAAYEYLLVSKNSPFDRWVEEGPESEIIPATARRGAKLFVGKASCIDCHATPLFSDNQFHNIGVPQVGVAVPTEADCPEGASCDCVSADSTSCSAWGAFGGLQRLQAGRNRGDNCDNPYVDACNDSRKAYYELEITDRFKGAWRTPTLRSVALTAPYMHTGALATLQEVVEHYDYGGTHDGAAPEQLSVRLRPLGLSPSEIFDLVAFLESLTGEPLPAAIVDPPDLP